MSAPREHSARVLVTGACGLIGSHVIRQLQAAGYEPLALRHRASGPTVEGVRHVPGDVCDRDSLIRAMRACDAVVHAAAVYSYRRSDHPRMSATNVPGMRNVLDAAEQARVARVVVTGTAATCGPVPGRPATEGDQAPSWELKVPYKATKLAAEDLALERAAAGQDVVVVNPTTTVGPGDHKPTPSGRMVMDVLRRRIRGYINSGGLNLAAVQDVARGHVLALERGRAGERYLLGGENLSMQELFSLIAAAGGVAPPRMSIPYRVALGSAWLADALGRVARREPELLVLDEVRLARLPMYFTSAKAEAELGYTHRSAEQTVAETVAWFRGPKRQPLA